MDVEKVELIYHPVGASHDPLIQCATLGLVITTRATATGPARQYGCYRRLADEQVRTILEALEELNVDIYQNLSARLLAEGAPIQEG